MDDPMEQEGDSLKSSEKSKICKTPDNGGCTITFKYIYDPVNRLEKVYAQKWKDCPKEVDLYGKKQ